MQSLTASVGNMVVDNRKDHPLSTKYHIHMSQPRLFANSGHWLNDTGHIQGIYKERDLVMDIRNRLSKVMPEAVFVPDDLNLRKSIDWINARATPDDVAIDIHLNANNNRQIRGTEAYYYNHREFAAKVAESVSRELKIPNRGARPDTQTWVGSLGFCRQLVCPSTVLEVCYMTNQFDMALIATDKGKQLAAQGIFRLFDTADEDDLAGKIAKLENKVDVLQRLNARLIELIRKLITK